jgi:hypothetical protein
MEAAVIWVATGDRRLSAGAAQIALDRRKGSQQKLPTLGLWLVAFEGLARGLEAVDGALYREEMREGWTPGLLGQPHPFERALIRTCQLLIGRHTTGQRGLSQRVSIPGAWWRSAVLVDDRRRGVLARLSWQSDGAAWQHIDVPAAAFRTLKAKRGRRPAGMSGSLRAGRYSKKTEERLKRKKVLSDEQWGIEPLERKAGRPRGSRNRH